MGKTMSNLRSRIAVGIGVALTATLGLGVGAAVAVGPALLAPAGLSAREGVVTEPMKKPNYEQNSAGESFGSAALADAPENEPDLILAMATNGKEGYVRKVELDEATGASAAVAFKSPEEALEWQRTAGQSDRVINVYGEDGKTVIGEFLVVGAASQEKTLKRLDISPDE